MDTTYYAIALIAAHFLGDWLLQTRRMAENKSKSLPVLGSHLLIVAATLCTAMIAAGKSFNLYFLAAIGIYTLLHGIQDWFIWKFYAKYYYDPLNPEFKGKAFYDTIAIDQFIHLSLLMYLFL